MANRISCTYLGSLLSRFKRCRLAARASTRPYSVKSRPFLFTMYCSDQNTLNGKSLHPDAQTFSLRCTNSMTQPEKLKSQAKETERSKDCLCHATGRAGDDCIPVQKTACITKLLVSAQLLCVMQACAHFIISSVQASPSPSHCIALI